MKNKTKSKIIITMNHLDHANKLVKFLKSLPKDTGGDLNLHIDDNDNVTTYFIGHDVNIRKVSHIIYEEE